MMPVLVRWIDAQRIEVGIQRVEEVKKIDPIPCELAGFLIYKDKSKVIIAQEKWDDTPLLDGSSSGVKYIHIIPRSCVVWIKNLEVKK